jgi:hypothetical protein
MEQNGAPQRIIQFKSKGGRSIGKSIKKMRIRNTTRTYCMKNEATKHNKRKLRKRNTMMGIVY